MVKKDWIAVYKRSGSPNFYCQIRDPETGRVLGTRSTGERRKREALIAAERLAKEILDADGDDEIEVLTFDEFAERYERDHLSKQRETTQADARTTIRMIREVLKPRLIRHLAKSTRIAEFETHLRESGIAPYTIKKHLSNVRKFLRYAHRLELIERVPFIPIPDPKDLERTKGRAISEEEFDRILAKVPDVVGDERSRDWTQLLRGLWLSGLRLGEALRLSWDEGDFVVDLSGELPRFRVKRSGEKSKRGGRYPITPDFYLFLLDEFTDEERTGLVFHPSSKARPSLPFTPNNASREIVKIGKRAGVKAGTGRGGEVHFASAHDYRRSFGVRWSKRVDEEELRRLMRHSTIETTREFYIGHEEDSFAVSVWDAISEEERARLRDHANNHANNPGA